LAVAWMTYLTSVGMENSLSTDDGSV
jgi:hypothetical protein